MGRHNKINRKKAAKSGTRREHSNAGGEPRCRDCGTTQGERSKGARRRARRGQGYLVVCAECHAAMETERREQREVNAKQKRAEHEERTRRARERREAKDAKTRAEEEESARKSQAKWEAHRRVSRAELDERARRRGANPVAPRRPDQGSRVLVVDRAMTVDSGDFCFGLPHECRAGASRAWMSFDVAAAATTSVRRRSGPIHNTVARNGRWSAHKLISGVGQHTDGWLLYHEDIDPVCEVRR